MSRPPLALDLLATPAAVSGVRRALCDYGDDVQLCASELVTNVIRHLGEGAPVTVRVRDHQGRTRLEVTDPDPRALPTLCEAAADAESGRGLALLDAVTLRWGVGQGPCSKTVWCELATPPSGGERDGHPGRPGGRSSSLADGSVVEPPGRPLSTAATSSGQDRAGTGPGP
jgi:hypothetical protein